MTSEKKDGDLSTQELDKNDQEVKPKFSRELPTIAEVTDTELTLSSPTSNAGVAETHSGYEKESNMEDFTEEDITLELPEFDWNDFENRFNEGLQLLDKEESQILDQFDQLMEVHTYFTLLPPVNLQYNRCFLFGHRQGLLKKLKELLNGIYLPVTLTCTHSS